MSLDHEVSTASSCRSHATGYYVGGVNERYVIRGGRAGYERLKVLAAGALPVTADLLDRAGVGPGMRCIDLGCGSGDVTFELARRVGSSGHATGVDQDDVKLAYAREEAAEQGIRNAEFVAGSAYELVEPGAYDVVYCRFLLQHLGRPVDMLRTMWAGVRPGGVIVTEDADFTGAFSEPANAGHDFFLRAYPAVLERHGGDPLTARKLYRHFLEVGIPGPVLTVRQTVYTRGDGKAVPLMTVEATGEAIVREGIATQDELDAAIADLAAFTADETTLIGRPRVFQVWARRPPSR